ncbi:autotransporter outer membrane beta-barrel domain-containing protein [Yersinia enterocolitica]|uniref:autotransporter outer membrane beta-barrel domain-containing protein n=1 Tax=Yersinia enterocolitica TaxID=630 RepID=UPI0030CB1DA8
MFTLFRICAGGNNATLNLSDSTISMMGASAGHGYLKVGLITKGGSIATINISAEVNGDNNNIKMSGGELTSSAAVVQVAGVDTHLAFTDGVVVTSDMVRHVISQRWQWTIMPVGLATNSTGAVSMNGGSLWQVTDDSDIASLALNDSTLAFSTPDMRVYKTLTVNGDSWLQYSSLNAKVNGEQLSGEKYDINSLSASVESGYRMPVYHGENGDVFVTPQAQVIWNGIKADDHTETNGTHVTSNESNNVRTRLGVKLSRDTVSDMDKGKDKLFTTYVEANWLHNTGQAGTVMDGVAIKQTGNSNVGELKLGAEGQLTKHANLWANVVQQTGYSDTALTV